jgi:hypothetical protein
MPDPASRERAHQAFTEVVTAALQMGGTITGEHGVGTLKAPWLAQELGERELERQRAVKALFDPRGILNPGAKVPRAGAQPFDDVKYDPALPPLPDSARLALERVERERAYASSRLVLLDEERARLDGRTGGA